MFAHAPTCRRYADQSAPRKGPGVTICPARSRKKKTIASRLLADDHSPRLHISPCVSADTSPGVSRRITNKDLPGVSAQHAVAQ